MYRAAISKEMEAAAENLNGIKNADLRGRYPAVFSYITDLYKQRNVLVHQYGHGEKPIDWEKIWLTIDQIYPRLEEAIENAIKDLESI